MRQRQNRALYTRPANMINAPTVVPTGGASSSQNQTGSAPYFSITVDTTNVALSTQTRIVLFDTAQNYQLLSNYAMPSQVVITTNGSAAGYQALLNDINQYGSIIGTVKMSIAGSSSLYDQQYGNAIDVYESKRGQSPSVVKTLYPSMGITEAQFKDNLTHFFADILVTARHALVYNQLPGLVVTFGWFQEAETGRQI